MKPPAMNPHSTAELEDLLSQPTPAVVEMMRRIAGDIILLGVAGKMGPSLARMARRAADEAGTARRVIGVSRFRDAGAREALHEHGIETISCDLLDESAVAALPEAPNVIYLAGMKFGATGNEPLTWAMNTHLPAIVCRKFRTSRIAAFSTGNIYGLVPVSGGGSKETDAPNPAGEYAMSCLGRERMFQYFSDALHVPVALIRLNYACDLRYGVLVDVATKVWRGDPVDARMGFFNTIWQGDANALSLLALEHAASPAWVFNLTGPELLSVRDVAQSLATRWGKTARIDGTESPDALLSDPARCFTTLDRPRVNADTLIEAVASWIERGGVLLGKPTHFESRDGKF